MFRKDTSFVFYEHIPSGRMDNMPERDWKDIQRNRYRSKDFRYIKTVNVDRAKRVVSAGTVQKVQVKDDPLKCPICGYVALDEEDLTKHKPTH